MFGGFVFKAVEDIIDDDPEVVMGLFLERDLIEIKGSLVDAVELVLATLLFYEVIHHFEGILDLDFVDLDGGIVEVVDIGAEPFGKGEVGRKEDIASS